MTTFWARTSLSLKMARFLCVLCRSYKCKFRRLRYCLCFGQSRRSKAFMKIIYSTFAARVNCSSWNHVYRSFCWTLNLKVSSDFQALGKEEMRLQVVGKNNEVNTTPKTLGKRRRLACENRADGHKCRSEFATFMELVLPR